MATKWRHFLANGLLACGVGLVSFSLMGLGDTRVDAAQGVIKVHVEANCAGQDNDPKVGAQFWISGTGFDAGIERFLAVTNGVNPSDPIIIGPVSVGSAGDFCAGPFSVAAEGHYKVYVGSDGSDVVGNHEKTKNFKTFEAVTTTLPETTAPETTAPDTTAPDTTAPDTTAPDTTAPDTTAPDTTAPETTAPETTVAVVTTTTEVASGGPTSTTTSVAAAGPTTTTGALPTTGQTSGALLVLGLGLVMIGLTLRMLARRVI